MCQIKIDRLTISLADAIVHVQIPMLIIITDKYFITVYRFLRIRIPRTILARREPARNIMCSGSAMLKFNA